MRGEIGEGGGAIFIYCVLLLSVNLISHFLQSDKVSEVGGVFVYHRQETVTNQDPQLEVFNEQLTAFSNQELLISLCSCCDN